METCENCKYLNNNLCHVLPNIHTRASVDCACKYYVKKGVNEAEKDVFTDIACKMVKVNSEKVYLLRDSDYELLKNKYMKGVK